MRQNIWIMHNFLIIALDYYAFFKLALLKGICRGVQKNSKGGAIKVTNATFENVDKSLILMRFKKEDRD